LARVVLLGTAAAVPSPAHGVTSFAVEGEGGFFLVDCGDSLIPRLECAGLSVHLLRALILTHFHPDHVAGVPLLLVNLWLLGRKASLPVFGLPDTLERLWQMMDLFRWNRWEGMYEVQPAAVSSSTTVTEDMGLRVSAAPVEHLVPTIGLRFDDLGTGGAIACSSDTSPCPALAGLAQGVDVLLHEASGPNPGHSSAAQAGEIARQAGAGRLVLVHYPPDPAQFEHWLEDARAAFGGPVELGQDFQAFSF